MALNAALTQLKAKDTYLLENDVNERSITHRLAMYLQNIIDELWPGDEWFVDCEYNRRANGNEIDQKTISLQKRLDPTCVDTDAQTIFPDIIIHRRGK